MAANRERVRVTIREACQLAEQVLAPDPRQQIIDVVQSSEGLEASLARLRRAMRSHAFPTARATHSLARVVQALDQRAKAEGFHVLESWDYVAHKFADDITPILMLDRCVLDADERTDDETVVSILIDQYFLAVLGLIVLRAWDDENPNEVFDEVTRLLALLGGGSGRFVNDAATLLLLAVSHYHPQERAYDVLIERIGALDDDHRLQFALACAPVLSGHFRWGLRFMYGRDFGRLRDDNVVDYPWLLLAVRTLVAVYCGGTGGPAARTAVVEGLLAGLSADPRAFTGPTPRCFQGSERDHEFIRTALGDRRAELLREFDTFRPSAHSYSPLGFSANFLCNAHVAMVATALKRGARHPTLDDLLGGARRTDGLPREVETYARSLMDYASGGRATGVPALIVYDPLDARHAYNLTVQVLNES